MDPIILLLILAVLIFFSAFYAASEIAIVSLPAADVADIKKKYPKIGANLDYHRSNAQRFVINISIANNFINILASSLATATMVALFPQYGVIIATVGMTALILLFGEIVPKVLAITHTKAFAKRSATPLRFSATILMPLIIIFEQVVKLIAKDSKSSEQISKNSLRYYVKKGAETGAIDDQEREYIQNIMRLDTVTVDAIMTPKQRVVALSASQTVKQAMNKFARSGFSRAPVYSKNKDDIIGVLHVKDLLNKRSDAAVKKFARKAHFVPEVKKVDDMLQDFQKEDNHFAIVTDVEGNYAGIITIEDVLEEIIGEIYDETDKKVIFFKQINPKTYHIQGDFELNDFNKKFGTKLNNANTVGGFIVHELQRIPEKGDKLKTKAGEFEIMMVLNNKVRKVCFTQK